MMEKLPNFFIVGAPKCGTTSMYNYLNQHPNIYFPELKEPNFFSEDFPRLRRVTTQEEYLSLFDDACIEIHKIIAEASVNYLYSKEAISKVLELNQNAKFLVMLRDPVDMMYSLHSQLCYTGDENEKSFHKAMSLQSQRSEGYKIPKTCREPKYLQYYEMCSLGQQVSDILKLVSKKNVLFVLQSDLDKDSSKVVDDVIAYLELPPMETALPPRANTSKVPRIRLISVLYHLSLPSSVSRVFALLKKSLGIETFAFRKTLAAWNRVSSTRATIDPLVRKDLIDNVFKGDILLLSKLIDKDLSEWLS